jgi:hypothetical protein
MRSMLVVMAQEYALHLFNWLWQTTLVAALALAVVKLAPRASARFRSTVLGLALWKLFLPPMLPWPTGIFSRLGVLGAGSLAHPSGLVLTCILALGAVHAAGAWSRLAVVWRQHRRLRQPLPGCRRRGRLQVAVAPPGYPAGVPVTFGVRRPAIVLPAALAGRLSVRQRRVVFAHERRHLERLHGLLVIMEEVLGAIGWVQPLFRRVIAEHRRVREELCDAEAVFRLRMAPAQYAACLLEVARLCGGRAAPAAALGATGSAPELRARITHLGLRARWSVPEAAAVILLWALLLPGIRPWPQAPASSLSSSVTLEP